MKTPYLALALASLLATGHVPAAVGETKKPAPFAVKVVGKGRPMILIPGLPCSGDLWNTTVEHFKDKYECHVLTPAGWAGQPPVPGPFLGTVRQGVADYIRAKKLKRPVIVGHSAGGFLAYWLGATEPDLVGPLVIVDMVPCLLALHSDTVDAAALAKKSLEEQSKVEKASREQFLAMERALLKEWIRDPKQRAAVEKWTEDSDHQTVARAIGEVWGMDLREAVAKIKTPVLLLGASEFMGLTRDQVQKRYAQQVAKIRYRKLVFADKARHYIMFDEPDWMFKQIDSFLAKE